MDKWSDQLYDLYSFSEPLSRINYSRYQIVNWGVTIANGYWGKILRANPSTGDISVDEHSDWIGW